LKLTDLPPNPFSRQPVKTRAGLAGRDGTLRQLEYYLKLTAAGDSPHLALIGSRGVGKTSLLNVAAEIAREAGLLVFRLDLDEGKTSSPGTFWHDFYSALLIGIGDAGLWGGRSGPIFSALFRMIHARRQAEQDEMVLYFPVALATAGGEVRDLHCSDALIVRDLTTIREEALRHSYKGLVVLVDEADCLGRNVELIQVLRNVFQRTGGCSLVLAGTDAVFPALTDVFSPIPRQFHRVDVNPFSGWWHTADFLSGTLRELTPEHREKLLANHQLPTELHSVCGGDPSELKIYCHHMYRLVEEGVTDELALLPEVFRAVLHEYRANVPANLDSVFRSIEDLPEAVLCGTPRLRTFNLTLSESVSVTRLGHELRQGATLTQDVPIPAEETLKGVYRELHRRGITESPDSIRLVGGAFTRGFWKAFVKADKGRRWSWDDSAFGPALMVEATVCMNEALAADARVLLGLHADLRWEDIDAVASLEMLRSGQLPKQVRLARLLGERTLAARAKGSSVVTDLVVGLASRGYEAVWQSTVFDPSQRVKLDGEWAEWIADRKPVLESHGISITFASTRQWHPATDAEIQQLAFIGPSPLDEEFGPSLLAQAFDAFGKGRLDEAVARFEWMVNARPEDFLRNDLAYCLMLQGRFKEAKDQFDRMQFSRKEPSWPLWSHNRAVLAALTDDKAASISLLEKAIAAHLRAPDRDIICMLLLRPDQRGVVSVDDIAAGAAMTCNLLTVAGSTEADIESELLQKWGEPARAWLQARSNPGEKGAA
jgi:hypothetical protein